MSEPPFSNFHNDSHELIVELARSIHTSGAASDELERRMELVAQRLNLPAHFFSTPTSLFVTFETGGRETRLVRVSPAEVNLARLAALYELCQEIESGEVAARQARAALAEIEATETDYGHAVNVICFGLIGGGAAIFLGGNWVVVSAAAVISCLVGVLLRACSVYGLPGHLGNVAAGFMATVLANAVQHFVPSGSVELTILASLIVLVPGLQITVSINELATDNLASGTARMAGALTTFLTMIFGVVMGYSLSKWMLGVAPRHEPAPLELLWSLVALLPVALSFSVLFRGSRKEIPWMVLSTLIAFATARAAGVFLEPLAAAWSAALVVGVVSNLFARFSGRPAAIMLMPGLLLLVPGSLGFSGLSAIAIQEDVPSGMKVVFSMALVAVSLVAGLLVAKVICPSEPRPKRD